MALPVIELPPQLNAPDHQGLSDLLDWVYDGFLSVEPARWPQFYDHRAVLAPTNGAANEINNIMLAQLPAAGERCYLSKDVAVAEVECLGEYSTEFLNSLESGGLPSHKLHLRPGALVILLRNCAPRKGLCNGTYLVVQALSSKLLTVRIVTGPFKGELEHIPRICCKSIGECKLPFVLRRLQFPVKLAWCMSIHKSQGQTIRMRLGIYLPSPVFSHGQLYVALSRVECFKGSASLSKITTISNVAASLHLIHLALFSCVSTL